MSKRVWLQLLLVCLILSLGLGLSLYLLHTKPKLARHRPKPHPPLVRVKKVFPEDYTVALEGFGTVYPRRTGEIVPEVSGKLVYVSPKLVAGGSFRAGEVLVRIDPRDYEAALALARAELKDAARALTELEAQAEAAVKEWHQLEGEESPPPPLVAKVPELEAARARLEAARAKVKKAELDLSRTVIKAPFDGLVLEAQVELGQYVSPGMVLAKVYDASAVEVRVPLEPRYLPWLFIPGFNARVGSKAQVFLRLDRQYSWPGEVVRTAAKADEKTRLLEVFVRVPRPFESEPPLLPGFFVRVTLKGRTLKKVFVLPRGAVHLEEGKWVVWLVKDERLRRREVTPLYFAKNEAVVRGLVSGDLVVLSRLSGPVPGMRVRLKP